MFKKVRNKILLINIVTLISFLLLILLALLVILNIILKSSGETYLKNSATEIIDGTDTFNEDDTFYRRLGYEFIIWNKDGGIKEQRINQSALIEKAYQIEKNNPSSGSFNSINFNDQSYRVYNLDFTENGQNYILQVFQETSAEKNVLSFYTTALVFVGSVGLIVLIVISYFLARNSLKPIKKSFDDQKAFIANASHELRTPLTVIQTSLDVIEHKRNETVEENLNWLNKINIASTDMENLISELLLIAQADSNRLQYDIRKFDLTNAVFSEIDLMDLNAQEKNIKVKMFINPEMDFLGDEEKIKQLVRIFLDNAIKYTPVGGMITVRLEQDGSNAILKFEDNGPGISKEEQDKIFDRFYRSDQARSTDGSGLGLNIAQTIVSHYNGKIITQSSPGEGTVFTVILPEESEFIGVE